MGARGRSQWPNHERHLHPWIIDSGSEVAAASILQLSWLYPSGRTSLVLKIHLHMSEDFFYPCPAGPVISFRSRLYN